MIFLATGWSTGQLLALRPGAKGEVIDANQSGSAQPRSQLQLVWKSKRNVPRKPSPLLVDDLLFTIDDGGLASWLEAGPGAEGLRGRVGGDDWGWPMRGAGVL